MALLENKHCLSVQESSASSDAIAKAAEQKYAAMQVRPSFTQLHINVPPHSPSLLLAHSLHARRLTLRDSSRSSLTKCAAFARRASPKRRAKSKQLLAKRRTICSHLSLTCANSYQRRLGPHHHRRPVCFQTLLQSARPMSSSWANGSSKRGPSSLSCGR